MTTHSQLTDDELAQLARAVVMAGVAVAVAKWSGKTGTNAELEVIGKRFYHEAERYPDNTIIRALLGDAGRRRIDEFVTQFSDTTERRAQDVRPFTMRRCDEAAEVLAAKATPEEAEQVKQAILSMCRHVAEESKEGDFLGFGGTRISPEETAMINEIARALKATPA